MKIFSATPLNIAGPIKMQEIPFFNFSTAMREQRPALMAAVAEVVDGCQYILGEHLARFESDFSKFCDVRHSIGVGNGLDALEIILRALDIGPGCEVIVPGHTFIATWLAVSHAGATLVPVDIEPGSFNIDPNLIRPAITPRTRAIIAVHLYGRPADVAALEEIAREYGIALIGDAAQAHGATHRGQNIAAVGRAAAFSFYPTKNLGALGDGGAITTNDDALAGRMRIIRNYGSQKKYVHEEYGLNSRLDDLQAAILSSKLTLLTGKTERRRSIARRYDLGLKQLPNIDRPFVDPEAVWHLYVIRSANRDRLQKLLADLGVGTLVHYPILPHRQPVYFKTYGEFALPESTRAAQEVLSLPLWPEMEDSQVDFVIDRLRQAVESL